MARYHAKYNDKGDKVYEIVDDVVTINKREYSSEASYFIMNDIQPYKSQVTGEVVGSRSQHRELLRRNNLVEIGNETIKPKTMPDVAGRREAIIAACKKHKVKGF